MTVRLTLIARKTFADLASPLVLVGYFLVFGTVLFFVALGFSNGEMASVNSLTVGEQADAFYRATLAVAAIWAASMPIMLLGAIASATTLATEAEAGTLQILLSKPVRRWEVLLGTVGAIVAFLVAVGLAGLLLTGLALYEISGVSAAALENGFFSTLPGLLAFVLLVAAFAASLGVALSVTTRNRLKTGLGSLVVPALYFAFLPIRGIARQTYEDYHLYIIDVSYHFGNAFVLVNEALGGSFDAETQASLAGITGVYDAQQAEAEELPASLDLVGHVPPVVSLAAIIGCTVVLLGIATYRFERMDV